VGGVSEPGAAEGAGDQVADGGIGVRLVPGADLLEILAKGLVLTCDTLGGLERA
jgi:hypothetical protein